MTKNFCSTSFTAPYTTRISKFSLFVMGHGFMLVVEPRVAIATPPWQVPDTPGGRLLDQKEMFLPNKSSSVTASCLPAESQVSVTIANVVSRFSNESIKEGSLGCNERAFVFDISILVRLLDKIESLFK